MERRTLLGVLLASVVSLSALWFYVNHRTQPSENGFGIYLSENNAQIVSDADVLRYNRTSHEITLANGCAERLQSMKEPLRGNFTVKLDGEEMYRGIFVPPVVSRSYPSTEVVIVYPSISDSHSIMKIQMGYPWDQPTGQDPRNNTKILQHFEQSGRLIQ
jgi:hypothetical protein